MLKTMTMTTMIMMAMMTMVVVTMIAITMMMIDDDQALAQGVLREFKHAAPFLYLFSFLFALVREVGVPPPLQSRSASNLKTLR